MSLIHPKDIMCRMWIKDYIITLLISTRALWLDQMGWELKVLSMLERPLALILSLGSSV